MPQPIDEQHKQKQNGCFSQSVKLPSLIQYRCFQVSSSFNQYWNKDWKPGPYPKTAEERFAAAKKYGLLPEDYEPYPDDGLGHGDYPKLPVVATNSKPDSTQYDMRYLKRNYGEPLHATADWYMAERYDPKFDSAVNPHVKALTLFGVLSVLYILYWAGEKFKYAHPVMPPQIPGPDKVHYTFEPKD
ncbi:NDUFB8 (predicted) [Pycnogonum litorale]